MNVANEKDAFMKGHVIGYLECTDSPDAWPIPMLESIGECAYEAELECGEHASPISPYKN